MKKIVEYLVVDIFNIRYNYSLYNKHGHGATVIAGRSVRSSVTFTIILLYFLILNPKCNNCTFKGLINVLEQTYVGQTASRSCFGVSNMEVKSKSKSKSNEICDTRVAISIIVVLKHVLAASLHRLGSC